MAKATYGESPGAQAFGDAVLPPAQYQTNISGPLLPNRAVQERRSPIWLALNRVHSPLRGGSPSVSLAGGTARPSARSGSHQWKAGKMIPGAPLQCFETRPIHPWVVPRTCRRRRVLCLHDRDASFAKYGRRNWSSLHFMPKRRPSRRLTPGRNPCCENDSSQRCESRVTALGRFPFVSKLINFETALVQGRDAR